MRYPILAAALLLTSCDLFRERVYEQVAEEATEDPVLRPQLDRDGDGVVDVTEIRGLDLTDPVLLGAVATALLSWLGLRRKADKAEVQVVHARVDKTKAEVDELWDEAKTP